MKNIIPILCCLFLLALIIISANENTELKKQIDTLYENKTTACYSFNEDLEMKINWWNISYKTIVPKWKQHCVDRTINEILPPYTK